MYFEQVGKECMQAITFETGPIYIWKRITRSGVWRDILESCMCNADGLDEGDRFQKHLLVWLAVPSSPLLSLRLFSSAFQSVFPEYVASAVTRHQLEIGRKEIISAGRTFYLELHLTPDWLALVPASADAPSLQFQ